MPRTGRLYVPMDVHIFDDARDEGFTDGSIVLFLRILAESKMRDSDGALTRASMGALGIHSWWNKLRPLLDAKWVIEVEPGVYQVPSWGKWHESQADKLARQRADRQRKRLARRIPRDAFRVPD